MKPRRSNKMPKDFAKRVSEGMKLYWANRKRREREEALRSALLKFEGSMFYGSVATKK